MSYTDVNKSLDYLYSTINDRSNMSLGRALSLGGLGANVENFTPAGLIDAIIEKILQINIDLKFVKFKIESLFPDIIENLIRIKLKSEIDGYIKEKMDLSKPEKINKVIDVILDGLEKDIRDYSSSKTGYEYVSMIDNFWSNLVNEFDIDNIDASGELFLEQWSNIASGPNQPFPFIYVLFSKSNNAPLNFVLLSIVNKLLGEPIPGWLIGNTVKAMKGRIKTELINVMNSIASRFGIEGPAVEGNLFNSILPAWILEYVNKTSITIPIEIWWQGNYGRVQSDVMMFLRTYVEGQAMIYSIAESQMQKIGNLFVEKAAGQVYSLYLKNPAMATNLIESMKKSSPKIIGGLRITGKEKKEKKETVNILPIIAVAGLAALYFLKK